MAKLSAGLLLYRFGSAGRPEVLIVHPGGPFWARKDDGSWSVPKGEYESDEHALSAARREFAEELGHAAPTGGEIELGEVRQSGGKLVVAWAIEGDLDASAIVSNTFHMEWPPKSGKQAEFPEVDRAGWFTLEEARVKLLKSQLPLLDALAERLSAS